MQGAQTFAAILGEHAARRPDETAFVFLDRRGRPAERRTYADLERRARAVAASLAERNLTGLPVLLNFPPGLEFVEALFGCFYAGCIAVPAPYAIAKRSGERIASICRDCDPAAMLTLTRFDSEARARGELPQLVERIAPIFVDALPPASACSPLVSAADSIALLQYTSGSTSSPKGVMLSHENLIANSRMIRDMFGQGAEVRGVGWLPLFHDMGLIGHVLQPVFNGGLSVLMSPLTFLQRPLTWLEAIAEWRATASGGPTYAFELCTSRISDEQAARLDLRSWQVAYCGSEPIRAETMERFADKFAASGLRRGAIYPCYGLAEATLMVSGNERGAGLRTSGDTHGPATSRGSYAVRRKPVACGRACPGETIAIVDPDVGDPVDDGEVGEIWVSGPNVGHGYWGRPLETADVFGARLNSSERAFLRTGDLGFVQDGEIYVVGRVKDMIIVRGTNHAPADIESTVASCCASFAGAAQAAFGVERAGREEVVVVQEVRGPLSGDETAAVFEQVSRQHGLRLYDLVLVPVGAIPRTSSGKVRRGQCRELYIADLLNRQNDPADLRFLGLNLEARAALTTA